MEIYHIPKGAISECRAEHRYVVLYKYSIRDHERHENSLGMCIHFIRPIIYRLLVIDFFP